MTTLEKIDQLLNQIRNNNNDLMNQARSLPIEDQKYYSNKISAIIEKARVSTSLILNPKNQKQ